ncbi:HAMP domain-containing sensor histidine kinase [Sulfurimonas sp. HSL1-2]|uniref:sensor histidine kinase n=1 Tax=Thiomicrolovo zhangzhouensis TaxID=3131933 RepID=UPI0031F7A7EC
MFRNFFLAIAFFYVVSVLTIVAGVYVLQLQFQIFSIVSLLFIALPFALLLGWMFSKIAIEPLISHFETLERFSKETLHELNIPVSTIKTNAQMLEKGCTDEKSRKRIGRIASACELLEARYDELDYLIKSQMQRERIDTVAIAPLLQERCEALQEIYPGITLACDLEPVSLKLDRMGFIKVVDNLIDNAVKNSPKGTTISMNLKAKRLEIRDEGRGMDEVELFKVFDRYYQSDDSLPGYGIGLDLVKRYCDRHRIGLSIDSAPGQGTTVTLNLAEVAEDAG